MNPPVPPYHWDLHIHPDADQELEDLLSDDQYRHVKGLFQQLAQCSNPLAVNGIGINPVPHSVVLFALRDSGGVLGKLKLRVLFALVENGNVLVGDRQQLTTSAETVRTQDKRIVVFWAGTSPIPEEAVLIAELLLRWY